jgi:hypothetical protein
MLAVAPVDVMDHVNNHVKGDAPVVGNHSINYFTMKKRNFIHQIIEFLFLLIEIKLCKKKKFGIFI